MLLIWRLYALKIQKKLLLGVLGFWGAVIVINSLSFSKDIGISTETEINFSPALNDEIVSVPIP